MKWLIFGILLLALILLCVSLWEVTHFQIVQYKIQASHIGKDHSFVFLSDLHSTCFGRENQRLIEAIRRLQPEAILIGGDMLVGKPQEKGRVALTLLEKLSKEFPIYYVWGNHEGRMEECPDYFGNSIFYYKRKLEEMGICFLNNQSISWPEEPGLQITGLNLSAPYYNKRHPKQLTAEDMEKMIGTRKAGSYQILLAHTPAFASAYARWGADLSLCGHYHGGLVGLPGNRGLISTQYRLFAKHVRGKNLIGTKENGDKQWVVVSAGIGTHTIPVRLFNPQQLVFVELKKD
jgi:hypothetical protein